MRPLPFRLEVRGSGLFRLFLVACDMCIVFSSSNVGLHSCAQQSALSPHVAGIYRRAFMALTVPRSVARSLAGFMS